MITDEKSYEKVYSAIKISIGKVYFEILNVSLNSMKIYLFWLIKPDKPLGTFMGGESKFSGESYYTMRPAP